MELTPEEGAVVEAAKPEFPSFAQHRDMIYHLLRFSGRTLLVLSKEKVWLANFQRQCVQQAPNDLRMVVLSSTDISHPYEILDELCRCLAIGVPPGADFEQRLALLQQGHNDSLNQSVLVIEHAEWWDSEHFASLFKILERCADRSSWRCLIFADQAIEQTLKQASICRYVEQQCHLLKLECQDDAIANRATASSKSQGGLIMDKENQPQGRMLSYVLAADSWIKELPFHWVLGGGVVLLLCLVISLQIFISSANGPASSVEAIEQKSVAKLQESKTSNKLVAGDDKKHHASLDPIVPEGELFKPRTVTPVVLGKVSTPKDAPSAAAAPITGSSFKSSALLAATAKQVTAKPQVAAKPATIPVKVAKPAPAKNAKSAIKREVAKVAKVVAFSAMEKNLLAMDSKRYTIQLLGGSREAAVKDFLKRNKLGNAWYANTLRGGKDWFVLYHGSFASRQEAKNALAKLPAKLRKMQPWPRKLAEVQKNLSARVR